MIYKALVSAHIWKDKDGEKEIEILSRVDNNDYTEIFDDLDHALIDCIDTGNSDDYYFLAIVHSQFERTETFEGVDYDVDHQVTEIKSIADIAV